MPSRARIGHHRGGVMVCPNDEDSVRSYSQNWLSVCFTSPGGMAVANGRRRRAHFSTMRARKQPDDFDGRVLCAQRREWRRRGAQRLVRPQRRPSQGENSAARAEAIAREDLELLILKSPITASPRQGSQQARDTAAGRANIVFAMATCS